ncbi:wax synthase family protein [Lignipirellula cremea]|uniref:Wax synthase domain-containing protein n=1 Tax=Lignipirellula cremea TaxID=2528010 RepID=A0A518DLF1_9BACT|nr:membrane bound O-acyl transferase family-domain-containing protein [Lignipirellula cremea]QDU92656.1 hypothetical protein Pla8534_04040 [Lignipirellula cremea]
MTGYLPQHPETLVWVGVFLLAELLAGFAVTRMKNACLALAGAWLLVVGATAGIERWTVLEPAGVRMLAIISGLLFGMKAVVSVEQQAAGRERLRRLNWLLFAAAWPGMRPTAFAAVFASSRSRWRELLIRGLRNLAAGGLLVGIAWSIVWLPGETGAFSTRVWLATIFLLSGLSLIVHFGLFNLLAGGWRLAGADCQALFRDPLRSTTLAEFWGRRWNLAFSEMTALAVFRPLRGVMGARDATLLAFLFSGLLHELAISVPVQAGYGLPLLYFALHAMAIQIEAWFSRNGLPVDSLAWVGRLWVLGWLLLPLPILFHPAFLRGCVWPLIGVVDGL